MDSLTKDLEVWTKAYASGLFKTLRWAFVPTVIGKGGVTSWTLPEPTLANEEERAIHAINLSSTITSYP
jgi:hypothetical protein